MLTKSDFQRIKARIDTPDKWTQNAFARTAQGNIIAPRSTKAVCFCIEGACMAENIRPSDLYETVVPWKGPIDIAHFNDTATHEEVMSFMDELIERAAA